MDTSSINKNWYRREWGIKEPTWLILRLINICLRIDRQNWCIRSCDVRLRSPHPTGIPTRVTTSDSRSREDVPWSLMMLDHTDEGSQEHFDWDCPGGEGLQNSTRGQALLKHYHFAQPALEVWHRHSCAHWWIPGVVARMLAKDPQ